MDLSQFPTGGQWIPAQENGSEWLLIALHGSEGSSHNFDGLDEIFDIPQMNYLYLNGPIRSYTHFRWYSDPNSRQDAYAYLGQAFDTIARVGYPPEKTFLLGFSQGAALTFEFGARYPHILAGYVAISGRIEGLPSLINQALPENVKKGYWFATHGTGDFNLSVDITRQQVEQLRQAGFHIEYQEYDKVHEFDREKELPAIREWILSRM